MFLQATVGRGLRRLIGDQSYIYLRDGRKPEYSFLRKSRGVVHVGANVGQERDLYAAFGLRVVWIEPIHEIFETLGRNIAAFPLQRALNYLIADEDGKEYQFHISTNSGESSSIRDLAKHKEMWPEVTYSRTVTLVSARLGTALRAEGVDVSEYDTLILDTQGAENQVLTGAVELLHAFTFVKVEVPDFEAYKGCWQVGDLARFMSTHGFEESRRTAFSHKPGLGTYFDILYRRDGQGHCGEGATRAQ